MLAVAVAVIIVIVIGRFWSSWSYHHPALSHDCRMLAVNCPSHHAVWVPNGSSSPTYGNCACAATVTIHGETR